MERTIANTGLRRKWRKYECEVNSLLDLYAGLSPEQRSYKPSEKEWSISQLFFHLEQIQELGRMSMQKRIESGKMKPYGFKHYRRYLLLKLALFSPVKYRVPKVLTANPVLNCDIYPAKWKASLTELENFLHQFPQNHERNLVFMHPVAGPFPVKLAVGFFISHLKHHKRQLRRIRSSAGFPGSRG